ncbi:MAG: hypothetical protein ACK5LC_16730 [Coprobacillaceae bacterium]
MVETKTLIIILLSFFITVILSEKYFAKNAPRVGVVKVMIASLFVFIAIGAMGIFIPVLSDIAIALAVSGGAFLSIYSRYKLGQRKGWRDN